MWLKILSVCEQIIIDRTENYIITGIIRQRIE